MTAKPIVKVIPNTLLRVTILSVCVLLSLLATPIAAVAHQSGCHSHHSCPSDRGTYTCGDTGNYSQCGFVGTDTGSSSATPDATADGASYANTTNREHIISIAKSEAYNHGYSSGQGLSVNDSTPNSRVVCLQPIKFSTQQTQMYEDGFQISYIGACTSIYNAAYTAAYATAYASGQQVMLNKAQNFVPQNDAQHELHITKAGVSATIVGIIVASLLALYGITSWQKRAK